MVNIVKWRGKSGTLYDFEILKKDKKADAVPGVYIFVQSSSSGYAALYIGEAENLDERLENHEKLADAQLLGMNQTHTMRAHKNRELRSAIEEDLIAKYQPKLNKKHNPASR